MPPPVPPSVKEGRMTAGRPVSLVTARASASGVAHTLAEARAVTKLTGLPAVIRPSFTLGGTGGGIAYNMEEFEEVVERGLDLSPTHQILIEESVIGWKEYELEVMRDHADNFVV